MSDTLPKLLIVLRDGAIASLTANMPIEVTVFDKDLEAVGESVGIVIETLQPDDVRTPEEFTRMKFDIINGLIDKGH